MHHFLGEIGLDWNAGMYLIGIVGTLACIFYYGQNYALWEGDFTAVRQFEWDLVTMKISVKLRINPLSDVNYRLIELKPRRVQNNPSPYERLLQHCKSPKMLALSRLPR